MDGRRLRCGGRRNRAVLEPEDPRSARIVRTKKRRYDFELTPFAGGPEERVQVVAVNRGFAFSLAVGKAIDPNNIWIARLMGDGGERLDRDNLDAGLVPSG